MTSHPFSILNKCPFTIISAGIRNHINDGDNRVRVLPFDQIEILFHNNWVDNILTSELHERK